jgi:hypothetical protein
MPLSKEKKNIRMLIIYYFRTMKDGKLLREYLICNPPLLAAFIYVHIIVVAKPRIIAGISEIIVFAGMNSIYFFLHLTYVCEISCEMDKLYYSFFSNISLTSGNVAY